MEWGLPFYLRVSCLKLTCFLRQADIYKDSQRACVCKFCPLVRYFVFTDCHAWPLLKRNPWFYSALVNQLLHKWGWAPIRDEDLCWLLRTQRYMTLLLFSINICSKWGIRHHSGLMFLLAQHLLGNHASLQIYAETKDGQVVQAASNRAAPRLLELGRG